MQESEFEGNRRFRVRGDLWLFLYPGFALFLASTPCLPFVRGFVPAFGKIYDVFWKKFSLHFSSAFMSLFLTLEITTFLLHYKYLSFDCTFCKNDYFVSAFWQIGIHFFVVRFLAYLKWSPFDWWLWTHRLGICFVFDAIKSPNWKTIIQSLTFE